VKTTDPSGPDLIALQDETDPRHKTLSEGIAERGYLEQPSCKRTDDSKPKWQNTFFIRRDLREQVSILESIDITDDCSRSHCATTVVLRVDGGNSSIKKLVISNVRLCGGWDSVDDHRFLSNGRTLLLKADQLRLVVTKHSPDIIVGDLTGERSSDVATTVLQRYNFYQNLSNDVERAGFLRFYQAAHVFLAENGYVAVHNESDEAAATSSFKEKPTFPDWVYVKEAILSAVRDVKVLDCSGISNHNAVVVTFTL
jgi:hypothetical protein